MIIAPIALFAYKRPSHMLATLEALAECELADQSHLYIYCDGPKKPEDRALTDEVRAIARSRQWCGQIDVVEQETNQGLAASVINGVTELCNKFGRVIVLEDDLVVAPNFLAYMNAALDRYAVEPRVMQISAYMFDARLNIDDDALLLPFTTSWGWGTWDRAWKHFDADMTLADPLLANPRKRRQFNLDDAYNYCKLLEKQRLGQIDSWAIRWYLSVFMQNGLVLFPKESLIRNIGFDGSGTHCGQESGHESTRLGRGRISRFPSTLAVSPEFPRVTDAIAPGKRSFLRKIRRLFHV